MSLKRDGYVAEGRLALRACRSSASSAIGRLVERGVACYPHGRVSWDAIVIGGGPAGSAAARMLARLGHRVLLIDRGAGGHHTLAQSIPPSTRRTLAALDLLAAVETADFYPWRGNTVWWAGAAPRVENFPPGVSGWQVVRDIFDGVLRDAAAAGGVEVRTAVARDVSLPDDDASDADAVVVADRDGRTERLQARFIIDCSGRAGIVARRLRHHETSHHTIALVGVWEAADAWGLPDETHTLVASYEDGWAWSIPTSPRTRYVTVMVDPARTALARGASSLDVYRVELSKVAAFAPSLARGALVDGPRGFDASLYSASRYAGSGFVLAGDAACFIDPLSSFGVRKALASAWLAAVAVHTALAKPSMRDAALAFHDRREREVYASYRRLAARFASEAAAGTAHPYWTTRADPPGDQDEGVEAEAALIGEPRVAAAFDDLRRRPVLRLAVPPNVSVQPRPAIRGHEIVYQDHLVLPRWPDGVRSLRGIDVLDVLARAPHADDAGALFEACRGEGPMSLPDFLTVLSCLVAHGALVHRDE
jgi:flavin-dependent dehydrogenase